MPAAYLENPRRFPRVPARLKVGVSLRGEGFQAVTEDLGPGGCLLVAPRPMAPGAQVRLVFGDGGAGEPFSVLGRVAWARSEARERAGVAFDARQPGAVDPDGWFKRLLAAQPGMASRIVRAPDRLSLDAPLYLLPPPRFIVDLSPDEADLLRRIDNGIVPRSLIEGRPERVQTTVRSLFALFEKRVLTLAMGQSVPAERWKPALASLEAESGGARADPAPQAEQPVRREGPVAGPLPRPSPPRGPPPVLERATQAPQPARVPPSQPSRTAPLAGPAAGRGDRPGAAQECLDRARAAIALGDVHSAIALLRRGIQLSPRDGEIAALLGELAFRGRNI